MAYKIMAFEGADFYDFDGQLAPKSNGNWNHYKIRLDDSLLLDRFDQILHDRKMVKQAIFPYVRKVGEDKYARCDDILCTNQIVHMTFKIAVYKKEKIEDKVVRVDKVKSPDDVRREVYEKGITIGDIHYVRWIHSSSNARSGVVYFINEELLKSINNFTDFGLNLKETSKVNIADVEATRGLVMSQKIGEVFIEPNNILVVRDIKSKFTEKVMKTYLDSENNLVTKEVEDQITNTIFDGQSLMDKSLFPDEYKDKGMLLLRHKAFKSCCFNANVQQWFKDNGITDISQLNGIHTPDAKLEDIKLITTESSIKYKKFGSDNWFQEWCHEITKHKTESYFGIVKYEKPTKYFDGRLVKTNYQILNTIYIENDNIKELLAPTIDYMKKLENDPILMYRHCKQYADQFNETNESFVYKMLDMNIDYSKTEHYGAKARSIINKIRADAKMGKILVKGNFSTMLSCPIEMLKEAIGQFDGQVLNNGTIVTKSFKVKKLLVCRNPHICSGNIYLPLNVRNELIEKYINLSDNIVIVNTINENIMQRLGGADFDSDQVMIVDDKVLIDSATKRYNNFLVPTTDISPVKKENFYTMSNLAEVDITIANGKIGDIVNISQKLNSYYWNIYSKNPNDSRLEDIYKDVCQLSILSMLEIDKAKRDFGSLDIHKEFRNIENKYKDIERPIFFKEVDRHKKWGGRHSYESDINPFKTTVNNIYLEVENAKIVTELKMDRGLKSLINPGIHYRGQVDTELIEELENICRKRKSDELAISKENKDEKNKRQKDIRNDFISTLNTQLPKLKNINLPTTKYIINCLESETKENQGIPEMELDALITVGAKALPKLISNESNKVPNLIYDEKGSINIYGIGLRVTQ